MRGRARRVAVNLPGRLQGDPAIYRRLAPRIKPVAGSEAKPEIGIVLADPGRFRAAFDFKHPKAAAEHPAGFGPQTTGNPYLFCVKCQIPEMRFVMILAHLERLGIIIENRNPPGQSTSPLGGLFQQPAVDQAFGDLHGVEGSALAQVVGDDPEVDTVLDG